MSNRIYNIDFFVRKFERIPDELWTVGKFTEGKKHCALGHCGASEYHDDTEEANALTWLFQDHGFDVARVNDGVTWDNIEGMNMSQLGDTPKERILNALSLIASEALDTLR